MSVVLDVLQVASVALSVIAALAWLRHLRTWPIGKAVAVALLVNALFYVAVDNRWLYTADHNLYSIVRSLALVMCLASLPTTIKDRTL